MFSIVVTFNLWYMGHSIRNLESHIRYYDHRSHDSIRLTTMS